MYVVLLIYSVQYASAQRCASRYCFNLYMYVYCTRGINNPVYGGPPNMK